MLKSNRRGAEAAIDAALKRKNAAAGTVMENGIKRSIQQKGLVDTGRYLSSITHDSDETGAVAGTNVKTYPIILELGSRYMRPYNAMQDGVIKSIPDLRRVYGD